jgi:aspartate oxidase
MPDSIPSPTKSSTFDLLVVGSGVAGLYGALAAADDERSVLLVSKGHLLESASSLAQGGIAAAMGCGLFRDADGLVAESALLRAESRGCHFRVDLPNEDAAFARHVVLRHVAAPELRSWA